jgi:tetratricopeptide (TPR) repeat protein
LTHLYLGALAQHGDMDKAVEVLKTNGPDALPYQLISTQPSLEPLRQRPEYQQYLRTHFPEKFDDLDSSQFLEAKPLYYPANCLLLAKAYDRQNEPARADALYEKALSLKPDTLSVDLSLGMAEAALRLGGLEQARSLYHEKIDSLDAAAQFRAGAICYQLREREKAARHFERYLAVSKDNSPENQVGMFYLKNGEPDLAKPFLLAALAKKPEYLLPTFQFALLSFLAGDKEEALRIMSEVTIRSQDIPSYAQVHGWIAYLCDPGAARPIFEKYGQLELWENLEILSSNQYEKADSLWQMLENKGTPWVQGWYKYQYLKMKIRQGKPTEALRLLEESLAKNFINYYQLYQTDAELEPLRNTEEFKALMKKYFPGKVQD